MESGYYWVTGWLSMAWSDIELRQAAWASVSLNLIP
jgi:hypothetical protein